MKIIWRLSIRCVESERKRAFYENVCLPGSQKISAANTSQNICKNSQCSFCERAHNRVVTNFHERAVTKPASSESIKWQSFSIQPS